MSFLQQAAQFVFDKHQTNYNGIAVVLPTRRAVYYFKRHLASFAEQPFLAPEVLAVEDFVTQMSGTNLIDSVSLTFELYEVFKEIDKETNFQQFLSWSSTVLKDFDLIDQYLVEPKPLFDYLTEAKAIARWNLDLQSANKKPLTEKTPATDRYFKLFDNLLQVYSRLHDRLFSKGQTYRGMAYRLLAEGIQDLVESDRFEHYYFIGFNALSTAENHIIQALVKAKKATTLWDTDDYYMKSAHKAGEMLQSYKVSGTFGKWNWQSDDLLMSEKQINIIGCQNSTLQAKIAGQLYGDMLVENPSIETAMVLADENLLMPLLYSLDENVEDFNITMGLSLRNSMLFTLIDSLFELQQNIAEFRTKTGGTVKIPKFNHRHIRKVLMHPFIKSQQDREDEENPHRKILHHLTSNNMVYLSEDEILDLCQDDTLLKTIFTRWNNDAQRSMTCFYDLIDILRSYYQERKDAIETEYLYLFLTLLNRLKDILESHKELDLKSFKQFLYELIRQTKIPFSGEPIAKLQIMGMLETRVLDFDRLIILSMNEGILPAGKRQNSLIPFDAAQEFGLPLHNDQDAVMSYHFFRLLQRAKQVDLLYVLPSGGGVGGGAGKSRFLMQVEHELAKQNPNIKVKYPDIVWQEHAEKVLEQPFEIQKNETILDELKFQISEKGLYPSHISQYIRCSMQYYFSRIAKISESEEIEETLGADMFGNWLHYTLEGIDAEYSSQGRKISKEDIEKIITEIPSRLDAVHAEKMGGYVVESGMNFLLKQVAQKLLSDFFKQQLETAQFPIDVLEVEKQLTVYFNTEIDGKPQKIKLAGRVDRIERIDKTLKIIDYKTGKVTPEDLRLKKDETFEDILLHDTGREKLRQLWLYEYLMLKRLSQERGLLLSGERLNLQEYDVKAGIYSFRNLKEGLLEADFNFPVSNAVSRTENFIETSEQYITQLVSDLLNPEIPFERTTDQQICKYCDFTTICGRG